MEGDNSRSQLGMLIVRRISVLSAGVFVFPRAFTEGAVEPLSTRPDPADTQKLHGSYAEEPYGMAAQ
jgi:hypothetical protein